MDGVIQEEGGIEDPAIVQALKTWLAQEVERVDQHYAKHAGQTSNDKLDEVSFSALGHRTFTTHFCDS
jgi:hypothetical protein